MNEQEITGNQTSTIEISHGVTNRASCSLDDLEGGKRRGLGGLRVPFRNLYVTFDLHGMRAAVDIDFRHARHGEEFEGVFDEGGIGEWKKTLQDINTIPSVSGADLLVGLLM